jgi:hypothetical protein
MKQLRNFLIQNIPADTSYFELYSGADINTLTLAQTNINPDKFGLVEITTNEYHRAPLIYYKWKVVDVFGNKSDFSNANTIQLDNNEIFSDFLLEEINPLSQITNTESPTPVDLIGVPTVLGFRRYRSSIRKINNNITSFSKEQIIHSNQTSNATIHRVYLEVQPKKTSPGEKVRIFWRAEYSLNASIPPYNQLFTSPTPGSFSGVIEEVASNTLGTYSFTMTSNSSSSSKTVTADYEIVAAPVAPGQIQFSVASPSIIQGGSTTLIWSLNGATEAYINNGVGSIALPGGSLSISPEENISYTLIAHYGDVILERVISVEVIPKPVITKFAAESTSIFKGENAHLVYAVSNANFISISGLGTVLNTTDNIQNTIDNLEIFPIIDTTYILTAINKEGIQETASFTITVKNNPKINSFEISPTNLIKLPGEIATLSYDISDADQVTVLGPDGFIFGPTTTLIDNFPITNLAGINPISEREVSYILEASKGLEIVTRKITFTIKTNKPTLASVSLPGSTMDLANISLSLNYSLADKAELKMINGSSPVPESLVLPYNTDGALVWSADYSIDFTSVFDSIQYAAGDPVTFNLTCFGPGGKETKQIIFDKTGLISIT